MDEILEAETFCRALEETLAGRELKPPVDAETKKDMMFAAGLSSHDLSQESRIRRTLKSSLLSGRDGDSRLRVFLDVIAARPLRLTAAAGLAVALLVPVTLHFLHDTIMTPYATGIDVTVIRPDGSVGGSVSRFGALKAAAARTPGEAQRTSSFMAGAAFDGAAAGGGSGAPRDTKSSGSSSASARLRPNAGAPGQAFASLGGQFPMDAPIGNERSEHYADSSFFDAADHPLSTFSIDVDAASYSNVRRFLRDNRLPPPDAARVEEMVNYFHYDYPEPPSYQPFSLSAESAKSPWNPKRRLVRIGIKGKTVAPEDMPPSNLVLLVDTSSSMNEADRLPLLKQSLKLLAERLRPQDRLTLVTFAGCAQLAMRTVHGDRKKEIFAALDSMQACGATDGGAGVRYAYDVAVKHFIRGGSNRVILATDGDFNVGTIGDQPLEALIEKERDRGVFLTVLGVGRGNLQDAKLQKLADKGNGNYAYIDDVTEAERVLVRDMSATLLTVAKDVKIQVEFNPQRVKSYRLIGYEKRALEAKDFNDDKKGAGALGAGRTVTALYEIIPVGAESAPPDVDALKYRKPLIDAADPRSRELLTIKARYKTPDGAKSARIYLPLRDDPKPWTTVSDDFRFATAVAGFGMLLRGSPDAKNFDYARVRDMAQRSVSRDEGGYRGEFIRLVDKAALLAR